MPCSRTLCRCDELSASRTPQTHDDPSSSTRTWAVPWFKVVSKSFQYFEINCRFTSSLMCGSVLLLLLLPICTYSARPVIISTDPGVDDSIALLLAVASPELQLKAVCIDFGSSAPRGPLHEGRSTGVAPRGLLHEGRSTRAAPRGVADLFYTDVRSILMVLWRVSKVLQQKCFQTFRHAKAQFP